MSDESDRMPEGVWVCSKLHHDGSSSYEVTVSIDADEARTLDAAEAVRYVAAVHRAAVIATHDAAVMQQMHKKLEMPLELAGSLILDLRARREPLQDDATAPLRFEPIVSATSFKPYVHVWNGDQRISQWEPEDCVQHAGQVMHVLAGVDLDSTYLRYLMKDINLSRAHASRLVMDLGNFHPTDLADDVSRGADE